jgi:adenylosuccinate synthase
MIPFELDDPSIKPVYLRMEGWKSDIAACSTADALPAQFLEYIKLIEKETGIRVEIISTGPDRVETLRVAH